MSGSAPAPVPSPEGGSTSVFVSTLAFNQWFPNFWLSGGQLSRSDHPHVKAIRVKHFWLLPVVGGQPEFYKPGEPGAEGPGACGVEKPYLWFGPRAICR